MPRDIESRLRELLADADKVLKEARDFTNETRVFRIAFNENDEPEISSDGTPFGVCDYYAMTDRLEQIDALRARIAKETR